MPYYLWYPILVAPENMIYQAFDMFLILHLLERREFSSKSVFMSQPKSKCERIHDQCTISTMSYNNSSNID